MAGLPSGVHPGTVTDVDRVELASYLRACRARVRPEDVGLDTGRRRRVPGLRRQEVASLAAMSVDYYIRLEQGRGPRPSRAMLTAIARSLQLSEPERSYLFNLAGEPAPGRTGPSGDVRPGVLRMLDRLVDTPALVCDARYDVLAWNPMAAALLGDFGALAPDARNIALRFFTMAEVRARHDERDGADFARTMAADLRAATGRYPDDRRLRALVARLRAASHEFSDLWERQDVQRQSSGTKRLRHPSLGWLDLDCEALHDPERDHWVILYTAAPGTPAHDALQLLRVVGNENLVAT